MNVARLRNQPLPTQELPKGRDAKGLTKCPPTPKTQHAAQGGSLGPVLLVLISIQPLGARGGQSPEGGSVLGGACVQQVGHESSKRPLTAATRRAAKLMGESSVEDKVGKEQKQAGEASKPWTGRGEGTQGWAGAASDRGGAQRAGPVQDGCRSPALSRAAPPWLGAAVLA